MGRPKKTGLALDHPSLFKRTDGPRVGVLRLDRDGTSRPPALTFGLEAVMSELSVNIAGECGPADMDQFDVVLLGMTSPRDAIALSCQVREAPRRARLIVGGQGVYGFLGWRHLTDRIMFGRAEGAADGVVLDRAPSPFCYDYLADPLVQDGPYYVRRARALLPGEAQVGCGGACRFCQYRAVRPRVAGGPGFHLTERGGVAGGEDRWADLRVGPGRRMTALDGWSEYSRRRVHKPVTDEQIVETLSRAVAATDGRAPMLLKLFQIVGYPWETRESVAEDIRRFRALLARIPAQGSGRVVVMVQNTPFIPEPLTDMERDRCDIDTDWLGLLRGPDFRVVLDSPAINAYNRPHIYGPRRRLERVAVNRGAHADTLRAMVAAPDLAAARALAPGIWEADAGVYVSGVLRVESEVRTVAPGSGLKKK